MTDSVVIVSCPSLIIGGKYSTNFGGGGGVRLGREGREGRRGEDIRGRGDVEGGKAALAA